MFVSIELKTSPANKWPNSYTANLIAPNSNVNCDHEFLLFICGLDLIGECRQCELATIILYNTVLLTLSCCAFT